MTTHDLALLSACALWSRPDPEPDAEPAL